MRQQLLDPACRWLALFAGTQPCITGVDVAVLAAPDLQVKLELFVRPRD